MNALLSLEPRVAGEAIAEQDAVFAEHGPDLHRDAVPELCPSGTSTTFGCYLYETHSCGCG